jgi:hypothetical protein
MTENFENSAPVAAPEVPVIPEFKFDAKFIEVEADASRDPQVTRVIAARLSKPTKADLIKREEMSTTEIVEASATEEEINADGERANTYFFDKLVTHVKGFRLKGEPKEIVSEWREATPELKALIPGEFKSAFVRKMYSDVTAKLIETDEDDGVLLGGGEILAVDLIFGDEENPFAVIRFDVPEPTETERRKFSNDVVKVRQPKGAKKRRSRIVTNLDAAVKFFNQMLEKPEAGISGGDALRATVGGRTFEETKAGGNKFAIGQYLDAIDATYKMQVISAAMTKYNVKVSD